MTLTGSGGCGKTRLSLQVAADSLERFPDGVWLVELAPLADPGLVPQTVATRAWAEGRAGQADRPRRSPQHLKDKRLLLLLDNCEHLLDGCARWPTRSCVNARSVTILASSREALGIGGEQAYRVPSLSLPDPKQAHTAAAVVPSRQCNCSSTVRCWPARISRSRPERCRAGLDLLSAGRDSAGHRVGGGASALFIRRGDRSARLDQRFRLLTGGARTALPRQQTLLPLIDWSYDTAGPSAEQTVISPPECFFAGGFPLELAQEVASDEAIDKWQALDHLAGCAGRQVARRSSTPVIHRAIGCWRRAASMPWSSWLHSVRRIGSLHVTQTALLPSSRPPGPSVGPHNLLMIRSLASSRSLTTCVLHSTGSSRNDPELEIALAGAAAWLWLGSGLDAEGIAPVNEQFRISARKRRRRSKHAPSANWRNWAGTCSRSSALCKRSSVRLRFIAMPTIASGCTWRSRVRPGSLLHVETSSMHAAPLWKWRAWKQEIGPYACG